APPAGSAADGGRGTAGLSVRHGSADAGAAVGFASPEVSRVADSRCGAVEVQGRGAGRGSRPRRADPRFGCPAGPCRPGLPATGGVRVRYASTCGRTAAGRGCRLRLPRRSAATRAAVDATPWPGLVVATRAGATAALAAVPGPESRVPDAARDAEGTSVAAGPAGAGGACPGVPSPVTPACGGGSTEFARRDVRHHRDGVRSSQRAGG